MLEPCAVPLFGALADIPMYVRASGREAKVGLQNAGFRSIAALALPPSHRYSPIIAAKPPESPKNGSLAHVFACRGSLAEASEMLAMSDDSERFSPMHFLPVP